MTTGRPASSSRSGTGAAPSPRSISGRCPDPASAPLVWGATPRCGRGGPGRVWWPSGPGWRDVSSGSTRAHHDRVATEEPRLRQAKLAALAEFAAGAGHELNNPLAVIVGRAQLLLVRETDPGAVRSLRAILTQAQRAHRILRDLMYVARPPEPRPRFCQPEEIVRNCLRDLRDGADERGVRLLAEVRGPELKVWADPDALRHVAEVLLRNALEATPKGGTVQVTTTTIPSAAGAAEALSWVVQDNGRGLSAADGLHLFDPFYCGRPGGPGARPRPSPRRPDRRAGRRRDPLACCPRPGDDLPRPHAAGRAAAGSRRAWWDVAALTEGRSAAN